MSDAPLLLGIDGGASGARLHGVERLATGRLRLTGLRAAHDWTRLADFEPVPLARQLEERAAPDLTAAERREGAAWVHTLANLVAEATFGRPARPLRVGLCLPGLKTDDGRGVAVLRRGPRLPALAADLERQLAGRQIALDRPLTRLHDDGDAAAWGEEWAAEGALAAVDDAYLVACGSGVAEGLKRAGRFPRVGTLRDVLPAPWETGDEDRLGLEPLHDELARCGGAPGPIGAAALAGDAPARALLTRWAEDLGAFLADRRVRLADAGTSVERVVLSARGGELVADPRLAAWTRAPLERALLERQDGDVLPPGFLVASTLRAAPAIGAAAEALGLVAHE